MDSAVQDNPAAPSSCQYTLHFLNRLLSSLDVSTSTAMSGCFQPGQAKVVLGPTPLGSTVYIGWNRVHPM